MWFAYKSSAGLRTAVLLAATGYPAALTAAPPAYEYDVRLAGDGKALAVEARFRDGGGCIAVEPGYARYLTGLEVRRGRRWRAVEAAGECIDIAWDGDLRLRYRFEAAELGTPGTRRGRRDFWTREGLIFGRPAVWLMRPSEAANGRFHLRFHPEGGQRFRWGVAETSPHVFEGPASYVDSTPYAILGRLSPARIVLPGGTVEWVVAAAEPPPNHADVERWIKRAAEAVSGYFGGFPVPHVLVIVTPSTRPGVGGGTTWGYGGASIRIGAGVAAPRQAFDDDWVLAHEMAHLAFPNVAREHRWMEEGLATYVGPIARLRAGQMASERVWSGFVRDMPKGQPQEGDQGLDAPPTWGRIYWGGALFWLAADVELLEKTDGRVGLEDVLRGIRREGGDIRTRWELSQVLQAADRAAGRPVIRELHGRLARAPGRVDLDGLWARLGIRATPGGVTFDDDAPLAWVRRRISSGVR